jgi:4'-phosphopantetheinyl transferase
MSAAILWREKLHSAACVGSVEIFVASLDNAAFPLAPTSHDLAEAPARDPLRPHFLAWRAYARCALAARLGVPARDVMICRAQSGTPLIAAPKTDLHISLAGRKNFCAVGVAPSAIGVDIEPLGQITAPAWNVLHQGERDRLAPLDEVAQHEKFLRIWTAKEAYLKALGLGLMREPSEIEIIATSGDAFVVRDCGRDISLYAAQWRRLTLSGNDFIAACVVLNAT